jgi:hypothetical protein
MAIQLQGNAGITGEIEANSRALRTVLRPQDYGALGHYRASHLSGTMAAGLAANAEIFQFRWTDSTRLALIHSVTIDGLAGSATAFAAGFGKVDLLFSRSWTADGSGGTAMTLTGNNQKLRTSMGTTLAGAIRGSSTAALTAGTKTNDTQPIGLMSFSVGTVANTIYLSKVPLLNHMDGNMHPIILAQNEGIVCRATVPGTGTWQFGISVVWSEVTSF